MGDSVDKRLADIEVWSNEQAAANTKRFIEAMSDTDPHWFKVVPFNETYTYGFPKSDNMVKAAFQLKLGDSKFMVSVDMSSLAGFLSILQMDKRLAFITSMNRKQPTEELLSKHSELLMELFSALIEWLGQCMSTADEQLLREAVVETVSANQSKISESQNDIVAAYNRACMVIEAYKNDNIVDDDGLYPTVAEIIDHYDSTGEVLDVSEPVVSSFDTTLGVVFELLSLVQSIFDELQKKT